MSNLLYLITNESYKSVLDYNLNCLRRKNPDLDVCCIISSDCTLKPEEKGVKYIFPIDPFEYRYSAKFTICNWDKTHLYENFLYLDTDAIPIKNLNIIFDSIEKDPDFLHATIEQPCLNECDQYHRFSGNIFDSKSPAYNAGMFGFNKKLLPKFNEFLYFIDKNKSKAYLDQSLYNEFFTSNNLFKPTISDFSHLYNSQNLYSHVNKLSIQDSYIVHFLGSAYLGKNIDYMKNILKDLI